MLATHAATHSSFVHHAQHAAAAEAEAIFEREQNRLTFAAQRRQPATKLRLGQGSWTAGDKTSTWCARVSRLSTTPHLSIWMQNLSLFLYTHAFFVIKLICRISRSGITNMIYLLLSFGAYQCNLIYIIARSHILLHYRYYFLFACLSKKSVCDHTEDLRWVKSRQIKTEAY